jgi:hypothetical protein
MEDDRQYGVKQLRTQVESALKTLRKIALTEAETISRAFAAAFEKDVTELEPLPLVSRLCERGSSLAILPPFLQRGHYEPLVAAASTWSVDGI